MASRRRKAVVALGSAALVLVSAVGAFVLWPDEPDLHTGDQAAAEFVEAWTRSKWGTYHVESTFERVMADGSVLADSVVFSQEPPDYVRIQFGGVEARIDDKPVLCPGDPDGEGTFTCTKGNSDTTYEELVEVEVARWDSYFFAPGAPLYEVDASLDGCFDLDLAQVLPEPPLGTSARFCFDEETGAMIFARIEREEGTDTTEAVLVRDYVEPTDLYLPGLEG